jgi:hypothetical protein
VLIVQFWKLDGLDLEVGKERCSVSEQRTRIKQRMVGEEAGYESEITLDQQSVVRDGATGRKVACECVDDGHGARCMDKMLKSESRHAYERTNVLVCLDH